MTLFHQTPQLANQLKVFPSGLNDIQLVNTTKHDSNDYFNNYEGALDGISIIAFIPIVVIGLLVIILILFFKVKNHRYNRGQLNRLEDIYQILETVDQIAGDPYAVDNKVIEEIRYALVQNDGDLSYFVAPARRNSLYAVDDFLENIEKYQLRLNSAQNDIIRLNNNRSRDEDHIV